MSIEWIFDATHYHENSDIFYKIKDGVWHIVFDDGDSCESCSLRNGETKESELIERPKQPQAWSGPEDGLPPVGIECEYGANEKWFPVNVIAHQSGGFYKEPQAVSQIADNGPLCIGTVKHFRPLRAAQQLAADQRESAIREVMDIAQVDCRVTAARLVDAGFKREGV